MKYEKIGEINIGIAREEKIFQFLVSYIIGEGMMDIEFSVERKGDFDGRSTSKYSRKFDLVFEGSITVNIY